MNQPAEHVTPSRATPYTRAASLPALLDSRIVILDGAMGTMIQRYKLDEAAYRGERFKDYPRDIKGNNELLSLTQPQIISEIHEQYLAAGADIIETNTFGATTVAQDDYGIGELAIEMNVESAKLARAACEKYSTPDKPRFAAGAIGPTPKTASISPDVNDPGARNVTFEELRNAYYEQAKALMDGGCDLFLVETIFDTLNAKAALFALDQLFEDTGDNLPIMISGPLPFSDGPEHVAVIATLRHWFDPAWHVSDTYVFDPIRSQYWLYHAVGALFALVLPDAEVANRWLLAASGIALPYALRELLRALRRDERLAVFAGPLFWNRALGLGLQIPVRRGDGLQGRAECQRQAHERAMVVEVVRPLVLA